MSRVSALYDLQQTDSKIDSHTATIANLDNAIADTSVVDGVRAAVSAAETAFVTARSRLRELEATAAQQEDHANKLEKQLYEGSIRSQKEMAAAQTEINTFRKHKKETDDQSVEAMIGLEEAENALKGAKEKLAATEAEWQRAVTAYREERDRLEAELGPLKAERQKNLKMVMPPDIPLYEKLRLQKQGVAVSEVLYGKLCSKCRMELPLVRQREIKGGTTIVPCPSCGRILYHKF